MRKETISFGKFYERQGKYDRSEELFEALLKEDRKSLDRSDKNLLQNMGNLASTYRNQGRWNEAEGLEVQVMETRKRVLGEEHPDTLTSMANLASTYRSQGRWKWAKELEVQVMETRKRVLGEEHPDTLTSMANLASTYMNQGRWKEAEELFVQVMETVLGEEHPDTLTSMANLASTYRNQGRWNEAEELEVQVLGMRKRLLGEEHPDTLTSMGNLASTYRDQARWTDAEELEVQVMELSKTKLGAEHPNTLTSMANMASTYRKQGRWDVAEELFIRVIETRKKILGADHPDTLTSMGSLASTYKDQGRWDAAKELEVQAEGTSTDNVIDEDCDLVSDVSDVSSVFSSSSSLDSFSSRGSHEDARRMTAQHLAYNLSKDPFLQPLYIQAMQEVRRDRFSRNHDRLLKKFLADLRLESRDRIHLLVVRFLRNRSQREQVTSQICQLSQPRPSLANQRTMQQYLDQEEDRGYRLERFLEASSEKARSTTPRIADGADNRNKAIEAKEDEYGDSGDTKDENIDDNVNKEDDEDDEVDEDDEDDEDELDGEIEGVQAGSLPHLESVVAFLTKGPSFQAFKSSLHHFIHPPTTIEEALGGQNIKGLRQLLKKRFDVVAQGEYSWIHELDDIGYTRDEIADLLFEQASDAPWIYFEPNTFNLVEVQAGIHLPGCVHQFFSSDQPPSDQSTTTPLRRFPFGDWRGVTNTVQELCGLAGITPTSRDSEKWNGSINFEERNSMAVVTYSRPSDSNDLDHHAVISRISNSLERFCSAAGYVQAAGLCCDSFTILRLPPHSPGQQEKSELLVEMCRIDFKLALQMLSELKSLSVLCNIRPVDTVNIQEIALQVLQPVMQGSTEATYGNGVSAVLQSCSLAVQLVCLGFLSYSQAHAGAIRPFFLDTLLRKIQLLGIQAYTDECDRIEASLHSLTCIGDMVQAPVLTFNLVQPWILPLSASKPLAYDLLTNAQDLLDTWGPGQFVIHVDESKLPSAIKLGDGIVFASDLENNKFHWSRRVSLEHLSRGTLDPWSKIIIGTPVIVNGNCIIDEQKCWENSSTFLEPLGPYGTHWELDEKQLGIQVGHYALLQAVAASHKLPAQTLKQHRLQQDDETLILFLDNLWGVQVSFCTRIARRVPLREMVADMLPIFAMAFISSQDEELSWKELKTTHDILSAFQQKGIRDWLIKLPPQLHQNVLKMVRRIFTVLQHTGLDRGGKNLLVAWPHEREIFRCFKIPCEKESSWVGILADSEDCATFAYVSTKCLETKEIKCNGPDPAWKDAIPMLETAVVLHSKDPARLTGSLQHNATYFFQKLDSLFFVRVQRPDATGTANLVTSRSKSPMEIQRRVLVKLIQDRKRLARLREKIAPDDRAERVAVSRQPHSIE
ncbi:uncharacterized protein BDR25DRAFT_213279 [Lindgomyces ingoldianus]|uniref:Uncharacterized protein n=1 Tax=Lindgomyces ingoldianus TaxID=673940 RepID=A0ACB6R7B0_9PLEO|nr:uncharacterized protein BDR25DRAFT_213279 [Lindgomyces ingoldianus]KAF2475189.1 hypothetical protein BDR25DRAFT_213279 [Lindgomyces ingoldianus]